MKPKTETQLRKMNRVQVIADYKKLAKEFRALKEDFNELEERRSKSMGESRSRLEDIAALQARCQTLRIQAMRKHERVVALEHIVSGLKMFDMARQEDIFDIRSGAVMDRISDLLRESPIHPPVPIHVCSICGKITRTEKGFPGERICEECRKDADWPWEGEIMWRHNEEGNLEGTVRGEYHHPDGGTVSVENNYKMAE